MLNWKAEAPAPSKGAATPSSLSLGQVVKSLDFCLRNQKPGLLCEILTNYL